MEKKFQLCVIPLCGGKCSGAVKMQGGTVRRIAKSKSITARQPAEWFNPVLDQSLPELADKLAEINADAVVKATGMMIK